MTQDPMTEGGSASGGNPPSEPPSGGMPSWSPPPPDGGSGGSGSALYGDRPYSSLTLTDAIMTGFRITIRPNFIIPIVVIGVIVNLLVYAIFVRPMVGLVAGSSDDPAALGGAVIGGLLGALIAGIVGGILLNLYGQLWATDASAGPEPTMQATVTRIGQRWVAIIGAGIVVALVTLAILLVGGILAGVLGGIGVVLLVVAVVVDIYVGARLSLAGWMAADGASAMDAVRMSWEISASKVLLIIGWGLAAGIVFAIVGAVIGAILGLIPLIGPALATAIQSAFGYGSGVTIYRKVRG